MKLSTDYVPIDPANPIRTARAFLVRTLAGVSADETPGRAQHESRTSQPSMAPTVGAASLGAGRGRGRGRPPNPYPLAPAAAAAAAAAATAATAATATAAAATSTLALEGRQVAASNSTLNAWAGSRRQFSWLANATPVQPTPRPTNLQPAPGTLTATSPPTNMTALPQPQHPYVQHIQQTRQPQQPQQPRQAGQQGQHTTRSWPQSPLHSAASLPPQTVAVSGPSRPSTSLEDPVLLSPAPSDEPSPCLSLSRDGPPTTEAHFVLDSHANNALFSPRSREAVSPANNGWRASPQGTAQPGPSPTASSIPDMAVNTPPTASASNTGAVLQDATRPIAPKRRRIDAGGHTFLNSLRAEETLSSYLQQIGGESSLEVNVERPRFQLLVRACRYGDVFFIVLHQLFCSWTVNKASVHGLCLENVHDISSVDSALELMGTVLKPNSQLREQVLQWFTSFPFRLTTLQTDNFYLRTIHQALDFLICVSKNWVLSNREHVAQRYPFLMSEFIGTFRLYSPILQSILFRASRRTIGAPDDGIGPQMEEIFYADQEKHLNPRDGTYSLRPEGEGYRQYNTMVVRQYQSLMAQVPCVPSNHSGHNSPIILVPSTSSSPGISSISMSSDRPGLQAEVTAGPRTAPPQMSTVRVTPSYQNMNLPSSSYSAVPTHSVIPPNTNLASAPYFATTLPRSLQNTSETGTITPPIPSQNGIQQLQAGLFSMYGQSLNLEYQPSLQQIRQYQQQQQQQQQQLHFQYLHRKRSQPGAVPSPRPSPTYTQGLLPGQAHPVERLAPRPQNTNNDPMSNTVSRNIAAIVGLPNPTHQSARGSPSASTQTAVQSSSMRPIGSRRQPNQATGRLIPLPGMRISMIDYPHSPYEKRSIDNSLHQAHLRSPRRIPKELSIITPPERHYQAIKELAFAPMPIPPQAYTYEIPFRIADGVLEKLTLNERIAGESLPVNRFSDGSLRVRMRCCSRPMVEPVPDHVWVTSDTVWPDHIFINLNAHVLECRRKQHHSKDLPIEITSFLCSGLNNLSISILSRNHQPKRNTPYIAVEVVETLSHSSILRTVHDLGHRPADEIREVVRGRLSGNVDNELETMDGISIDLADPFTTTIFEVPVRGTTCTHLECFDLENWLNTRPGKRTTCVCDGSNCRCPREPSFVDRWKCPLCDGDARPYNLRIDGFLTEVRSHLKKTGQLRTKSITVFADGSWKVNDLPHDEDSGTESDDKGTPATFKGASKFSAPRTIIELDDD